MRVRNCPPQVFFLFPSSGVMEIRDEDNRTVPPVDYAPDPENLSGFPVRDLQEVEEKKNDEAFFTLPASRSLRMAQGPSVIPAKAGIFQGRWMEHRYVVVIPAKAGIYRR